MNLSIAAAAWQQTPSPGQPVEATVGCAGEGRWQDDGLSLWAFPQNGARVPSGKTLATCSNDSATPSRSDLRTAGAVIVDPD